MNKLLISMIAGLSLTLTGCGLRMEAERQVSVGSDYNVDVLFTVDDCTVYRFFDKGTRYFTNCKGSTQWDEQQGKYTYKKGVEGGVK